MHPLTSKYLSVKYVPCIRPSTNTCSHAFDKQLINFGQVHLMNNISQVWSMLLASLLLLLAASSAAPADALSAPAAGLTKRSLFDPSCTGVFDRQLLRRLRRVCDDCFNVFREPNVSTECRSVIYGFPFFFTFPTSIPFARYQFHCIWHGRLSKAPIFNTNHIFLQK